MEFVKNIVNCTYCITKLCNYVYSYRFPSSSSWSCLYWSWSKSCQICV